MGCGSSTDVVLPEGIQIQYFKAHGRPEPLRAMLYHAGKTWTEMPVSIPTWIGKKISKKPNNEFGLFLPIFYWNGKKMTQTTAVLRAIGIEYGYYNPNDWQEAAKIDWILHTWNDCLNMKFL